MKLNSPITVNFAGSPILLEELDLTVIDKTQRKTVAVKIHPLANPLFLWRGPEYDKIGDYTQSQVEARILELLGENLTEGLQRLFNIEVL